MSSLTLPKSLFFSFLSLKNALVQVRSLAIVFLAHAIVRVANGSIPQFGKFLTAKGLPTGTLPILTHYPCPMLIQITPVDKKNAITFGRVTIAFVLLVVSQDLVRAYFNKSAFYLSESVMFSTFWWIFAPLLVVQYKRLSWIATRPTLVQAAWVIALCLIHLLAFPLIIWILSSSLYYHTYGFLQTLTYAFAEYAYLLVAVYAAPILVFRSFYKKTDEKADKNELGSLDTPPIHTILVAEGSKKLAISVDDVLYFQAASPYIWVQLEAKKYLANESLKSMARQLKSEQFVRVHKSTLVNMHMVVSYTSRLNGDYDLMLKNKGTLRVSRNFAAEFKQQFGQRHRLA